MFHTIGQRQGLGIGGRRAGSGEPWYVAAKILASNTLIVVQGHNHPALFHRRLRAVDPNWIAGEPPTPPLPCQAKIRYRQPDQGCILEKSDERGIEVRFVKPQRAITPGQSVVFYVDEVCLAAA